MWLNVDGAYNNAMMLVEEKKVFISYENSTARLIEEIEAKLRDAGFCVIKIEINTRE